MNVKDLLAAAKDTLGQGEYDIDMEGKTILRKEMLLTCEGETPKVFHIAKVTIGLSKKYNNNKYAYIIIDGEPENVYILWSGVVYDQIKKLLDNPEIGEDGLSEIPFILVEGKSGEGKKAKDYIQLRIWESDAV